MNQHEEKAVSEGLLGLQVLGIKIPQWLINDKEAVKVINELVASAEKKAYEKGREEGYKEGYEAAEKGWLA